MMTTIQRTTKRRLAAAMLFVWLFALVSGIANACLLGGLTVDLASRQVSSHHHDDLAGATSHGHVEHDAHDAPLDAPAPGSPDHEACQKFCDDGESSIHAVAKNLGSPGSLLPLLVQFTVLAWTSEEVRADEALPVSLPCVTGPPIPIRLLRLTI